jgi:hypothetical protein
MTFPPSLAHHHTSKERPPPPPPTHPRHGPAVGHTHLNTHDYSHNIPKHAYMTCIQLLRRAYTAGHFVLKGHAASPCLHAQEPYHGTHISLSTYSRGTEKEVCAKL